MRKNSEPELKRIPLEEVCLNILAAGMSRNCKDFLCQAPQPPTEDAVIAALNRLKDIGAVLLPTQVKPGEEIQRSFEVLTPLGRHLSRLPVDVLVGKMLIFGAMFRCIDPIATIAASLSASQSVFQSSLYNNDVAKVAQSSFRHPQSDFLTLVNVFDAYREAEAAGHSRRFCREKHLNLAALREIQDARKLYVDLLCGIGLMDRKSIRLDGSDSYNVNGANETVLHSVVLSGVYPHVARVVSKPTGKRTTSLVHRDENLEIHSSSVNSKLTQKPSLWIAFHEKFGTAHRVSVSTTCFVTPFALMLFGCDLEVLHLQRKVVLDGWIGLAAAAKTGVTFREVRSHVNRLLETYIAGVNSPSEAARLESKVAAAVDALVGILTEAAQ